MAQRMSESCSRRCARGSMRQPTTHRFIFPRGANCSLSSICLPCSVTVPRAIFAGNLVVFISIPTRSISTSPHGASNIYCTIHLGKVSFLPLLYFSSLSLSRYWALRRLFIVSTERTMRIYRNARYQQFNDTARLDS